LGAGDPRNLDLAWVADAGRSDALGLSLLYLLVARRLDLEVEAVDYPGHFFCRIHEQGHAYLIDCFDFGRPHLQDVLLTRGDIGRSEKQFLASHVGPGGLLLRVLSELEKRLGQFDRHEDAELIGRLHALL
jgi:regulator of sirC expression with transglutaminase-like and TPR domain